MHLFSYYEFRFQIQHCRRVGTNPVNIMGRLKWLAVSNDRGIVAGYRRLWEQEVNVVLLERREQNTQRFEPSKNLPGTGNTKASFKQVKLPGQVL